jgi:chorismate mutase
MNSTPDDKDVLEILMDVTSDISLLFIAVALRLTKKAMGVIALEATKSSHVR